MALHVLLTRDQRHSRHLQITLGSNSHTSCAVHFFTSSLNHLKDLSAIHHFCIIGWFPAKKKSILKMQVTKTTLTLRSGWFWLPVFPILIFESWKPANNAKMVNIAFSNPPEAFAHNPETMALLLTRDLRSCKHLQITVGSDSHSKQLCNTSSDINCRRLKQECNLQTFNRQMIILNNLGSELSLKSQKFMWFIAVNKV